MSFDPGFRPPADPESGAHPSVAPQAPAARPSRVTPWIGVGATLVCLLVATSVMGAPAAPAATAVSRWLPPDGSRSAFTADAATYTVEWSQPAVHSLFQFNSPTFGTWAQITETDWTQADYLRVTSQRLDEGAAVEATGEDLWVVDDAGARTIAESRSDTLDAIWEPGRLDLPADLGAGATWSSQGDVVLRAPGGEWEVAGYHAAYRAAAPAAAADLALDCVVVTMTLTVNGQDLVDERTWCPGAGVVASQDSESNWTPTVTLPQLAPAGQPVFDWSRADELEFTDLAHSRSGLEYLTLSPISTPGLLPDGGVVVANRLVPDLMALDPADNLLSVRWVARPGGTLTSAATLAGITVVTTTQRSLIGYGPGGQWLWQASLSDLTRIPPVLAGTDLAVVVTLDGAIVGYDLSTGAERWRTSMGTEIRRAPLVAGERILVTDAAGALSCLDLTGAELWTIDAGRVSSLAVSDGQESLVAVGRSDSAVVRAYSLTDGGQVWRRRILENAQDLVSLGDRFVLRDDDRLVGMDAATGAPLWTAELRSERAIGDGNRVLLLTDSSLVLVDRDGRQVREWAHQLGDVGRADSYLEATGDAVIAAGPTGFAVGRLP